MVKEDNKCMEQCKEHSRIEEIVKQVPELWKTIHGKVEKKLFYILILLVVGSLGFSWAIYERVGSGTKELNEKINQGHKDQAVFTERVTNFMSLSIADRAKLNLRVDELEKRK